MRIVYFERNAEWHPWVQCSESVYQGRFFSGLVQQFVSKHCCAELQTVPVSVSAFALCLLFSPRVYPSKALTSGTNNVHQKGLGYGFGIKIGVAVSWEMLEVAFRAEWIHPGMKNMRSALAVFQGIEILFSFFLF